MIMLFKCEIDKFVELIDFILRNSHSLVKIFSVVIAFDIILVVNWISRG
jgi:hypothetical protein